MVITLKKNHGYELTVEADNVKIVEDVEDRIYHKGHDGKTDYMIAPKRDIKTTVINQFVEVLDDMIYYRESKYDSSGLIERLFEKLPTEIAENLINKLKDEYVTSI